MKIQKKSGNGLYLQRRNNKRWKWMAGATAATAAGVTASQASTITINLTNNFISATGGNHLNADLTGDGHSDITISNTFFRVTYRFYPGSFLYAQYTARVHLNSVLASAFRHNSANPNSGTERLGSQMTRFVMTGSLFFGTYQLTGSIPLSFKDLHINGGAPTSGLLQVTVSTRDGAKVQLDSFTYNTRAVPDHGSSLALLALGATGVLALRRWRTAQVSQNS